MKLTRPVITVQNVTSIAEKLVLPGHIGSIRSHAFSIDGQWLALGTSDGSKTFVELYDLLHGQLAGTIPTGWNGAEGLAFHPTAGTLIITSGNAPSFEIRDPATRKQLRLVVLPVGHQPGRVAVTSSGETVITGGFDGQVLLWSWHGGNPTLRASFQAHNPVPGQAGPFIEDLAFSNDCVWLATASSDDGFKVWRITFDGLPEEQAGSDPQAGRVHAVGFDAGATRLAAACDGNGGRLRLIELPTGRLLAALSEPPGVQNQQMFSCAVAPSEALVASAQSLASAPGCMLQFWSNTDGAHLYSVSVLCDRLGFSPDGTRLLVVRNIPGSADVPTLWGVPRRLIPPIFP